MLLDKRAKKYAIVPSYMGDCSKKIFIKVSSFWFLDLV